LRSRDGGPFGVAVYLSVVGIEHAIRYFVDAREREVQMARLSEQQLLRSATERTEATPLPP